MERGAMEIFIALFTAVVCTSMAKKRGRGPVKWFFLGLFFNLFAVIALFLMGNADSLPNYNPPPAPQQTYFPPAATQPPVQRPNAGHQTGEVDLNSLRDAVRRNSPSSATQNPGAGASSPPQDNDRVEFQRHLNTMLPTLVYPNVPSSTNEQLRQMWSRLGRNLVDSGLPGGVNDDYEFYVVLDNGTPVYFAPCSLDGTPQSLAVQFGMPLKRFMILPDGLQQWAGSQPMRQSVEALIVPTGNGSEHVLWGMACYDPSQVTEHSLNSLCNSVFNEASRIRDAVPMKFGGMFISNN